MADGFKAYDLISLHAGVAAGVLTAGRRKAALADRELRGELVNKVAQSAKARKLRDQWTQELDDRLHDLTGWSLDQLVKWFAKTHGKLARSSMQRARAAIRADRSRIAQAVADAKAFVDLAEAEGPDSMFAAVAKRYGQLMFQMLMEAKADEMGGQMNLTRMSATIKALASLQKARAETELIGQKVAEMGRIAKRDISKAAGGKDKGRKITVAAAYEVIDRIMKGEAA